MQHMEPASKSVRKRHQKVVASPLWIHLIAAQFVEFPELHTLLAIMFDTMTDHAPSFWKKMETTIVHWDYIGVIQA